MLAQQFGYRKDAAPPPEPDRCPGAGRGRHRQSMVEDGKMFPRKGAVAARSGCTCRVELRLEIEPARDAAQTQDLAAQRQGNQKLATLKRLVLHRQSRQT